MANDGRPMEPPCSLCPGNPHPADPDVEEWMARYRASLAAWEASERAHGRAPGRGLEDDEADPPEPQEPTAGPQLPTVAGGDLGSA